MKERQLGGRYEIITGLGEGGMSHVYVAMDRHVNHEVAVKIVRGEDKDDREHINQFETEAAAYSRLTHHNIVNLLDVGQEDALRYLVLEYVRGCTLKDLIEQHGRLSPYQAVQIGRRILSGLSYMHNKGVIHRDIKPQNILVDNIGYVKITDFGNAQIEGRADNSREMYGSVFYLSPEQARGEKHVTAACDLYSVGVVLYEMLTGQVPFSGDSQDAILRQHLYSEPTPVRQLNPAVPETLAAVVARAMKKDPAQRYRDAVEMGEALQKALDIPDMIASTMSHTERLQRISQEELPDKTQKPPLTKLGQRFRQFGRKKLVRFTAGTLLCAALLTALVIGGMRVYDQVVNTVDIPYLIDETAENAKRALEKLGLKVEINRADDSEHAAGTVAWQTPAYPEQSRRGETVTLLISTGPGQQPVPDIRGKTVTESTEMLENMGFVLLTMPVRVMSEEKWDTVVAQYPDPETVLQKGGVVQVTLSGGQVTLPNLVGTKLETAGKTLEQLGLTLTELIDVPVTKPETDGIIAAQKYQDNEGNEIRPGASSMQGIQVVLAVYVYREAEQ